MDKIISEAHKYYYRKKHNLKAALYCRVFKTEEELNSWLVENNSNIEEYDYVVEDAYESELNKEMKCENGFID